MRRSGRTRNQTSRSPEKASRKSKRSRASRDTPQLVSTHPEPRPIDASRYTLTYLLGEKNKNENSKSNEDWFKRLDFVNVGDDVIQALFVLEWHKIKESKVILPPPSHRRDRGAIVSFLRLGPGQKRSIIKEWRDCSLDVNFDHDSDDNNIEEGEEEGVVYEVTDCADDSPDDAEENEVRICRGVTLDDIRTSKLGDKEKAEAGFIHVCREAIISRTKLSRPGDHRYQWTIANNEAFQTGVVTSGTGDDEEVIWTLEEVRDAKGTFEGASIRHLDCKLEVALDGKYQCEHCNSIRRSLFRRCYERVQIRETPLSKHTNTGLVNRAGTLQAARNMEQKERLLDAQKRNRKAIFLQRQKDIGVEVDTKEADYIFSDDMLPHLKVFLEAEVGPDSIAEYLIEESFRKQKIAKRLGRTAIRHDPLAIRLGIIVRNKMGYHGGLYDLLAKIAGLPCDRTLNQYKVPNSNDPDGFIYSTVG
jgi:hypothetical protein